jgi:hypothetical protein
MADVIIGTVTLERVLDWEDEETIHIPIKRIVRRNRPTTQAPYFSREPNRIIITAKVSRSTRVALRNLKNQVSWQPLYDADGSLYDYVWIERLNHKWYKDRDHNYPWLMTIDLICSST